MDDALRKKRIERLRLARLAAAGKSSNKEEMNAFIDTFDKLSKEWGITLEEIENATAEQMKARYHAKEQYSGEVKNGRYGWAWVDYFLWKTIARFCTVKIQTGLDSDGDLIVRYFGEDSDVELAIWLRAHIKAAMKYHWDIYEKYCMEPHEDVAKAIYSFHHDMADEIKARMDAAVRRRVVDTTGTALIIRKTGELEKQAAEAGFVEERGGAGYARSYDSSAGAMGRAAGATVDIGRAVSGVGGRMITKQS